MRINRIYLEGFPPFTQSMLELEGKPASSQLAEVHLLTGQNGTGKTRLLSLLAASLGSPEELAARVTNPAVLKCAVSADRSGASFFWRIDRSARWWPIGTKVSFDAYCSGDQKNPLQSLGGLVGNSPETKAAGLPPATAMAFRGSAGISDAEIAALKSVSVDTNKNLLRFNPTEDDKIVGQSLANLKVKAAMDSMSTDDSARSRHIEMITKLETVVTEITGRPFSVTVDTKGRVSLKFKWNRVVMELKQLPDGLRSIIGWLVACVAKLDALFPDHDDPLSLPLVLLLDEPETHLHPAWQRKLIPAAQKLFPNAQIFVATHSPFVISSVNEGWIHIFRIQADGTVTCEKPRACSKGDSYLDVVEDVLGVKEWYDPETEGLLSKFRTTRDAILTTREWSREAELRDQAEVLGRRSQPLRDTIGRELQQFERLKQKDLSKA